MPALDHVEGGPCAGVTESGSGFIGVDRRFHISSAALGVLCGGKAVASAGLLVLSWWIPSPCPRRSSAIALPLRLWSVRKSLADLVT